MRLGSLKIEYMRKRNVGGGVLAFELQSLRGVELKD